MWNLNTTTSHSIHSEYIDFEDKAAKRQSEEIDQAFEDVNVELRSKCALFLYYYLTQDIYPCRTDHSSYILTKLQLII